MLIMAPSVSAEPLHESSSRHAVVHTHRVVNRVVVARQMLIRTVTTISAFSLNNLPAGYARLIRGDETFYFSRGVYYKRKPHGFVIVKPRVGFSVAVLPSGYKTIRDSGATFYSFNNVRYRKHNGFFVVV
jgi:hypothetical protein